MAHNVPWDPEVTNRLHTIGIDLTGKIISDQGFMIVFEIMRNNSKFWMRAIDMSYTAPDYLEKMFPEAFAVSTDLAEPSDNVVPILETILVNQYGWIFVVTPAYVVTLSMYNRFNPLKNEPHESQREWFSQIISGLTTLQGLGYVHGDLCPDNIWIDSNNRLHLAGYSTLPASDFNGLSVSGFNDKYKPLGECDPVAADVWALAAIMFEMLSGEPLLHRPDMDNDDVMVKIECNHDLDDTAKHLIEQMLEPDVSLYAKLGWITDHDYFAVSGDAPGGQFGSSPIQDLLIKLDGRVALMCRDEQITVKRFLGGGAFGAVYRVKYQGEHMAMKVIEAGAMDEEQLVNEEKVTNLVNHRHVIKAYRFLKVPRVANVVLMEFAFNDLQKQLELVDDTNLARTKFKQWLNEYAQGLAYLHSVDVTHQDIKPDNCLIRLDDSAAVADFSLAYITEKGTMTQTSAFQMDVIQFGYCVDRCQDRVTLNAEMFIRWTRNRDRSFQPTMQDVVDHEWFKAGEPSSTQVTSSRAREASPPPAPSRPQAVRPTAPQPDRPQLSLFSFDDSDSELEDFLDS